MKPIKFKESNVVYAENQEEYLPLPVLKDESGCVVSCWSLSFKERLRLLFKGNVWLSIHTFNQPLQPLFITTIKEDVIQEPTNE